MPDIEVRSNFCQVCSLSLQKQCMMQAADRSLSELKEFAGQLKTLPQIQRHIALAEAVNQHLAKPGTRARVAVEQDLLEGQGIEASCESIEVRADSKSEFAPL